MDIGARILTTLPVTTNPGGPGTARAHPEASGVGERVQYRNSDGAGGAASGLRGEINAEVMLGKPVIRGTRVTVELPLIAIAK